MRAIHNLIFHTMLLPFAAATSFAQGSDDSVSEEHTSTKEESDGGGFVALPIVITEPAIGEGLGVGLVYFHKKDAPDRPKITTGSAIVNVARRPKPPPTATGVFAAYTSSDTAAIGIGHSNSLQDDKYRIVGALASMRVNAAIFVSDIPFDFELNGDLIFGNVKRRIGESNAFFGLSLSALKADVNFGFDLGDEPPASLFDFDFTSVGVAGAITYDIRDDSMMPSTGQVYDFTLWRYDDAIGSDFDYWNAKIKINSFHKLTKKTVLGLRFETSTVEGDAPFYAVPFVSLRGIPALRFQGDTAGVFEVEARYRFAERWAGVAFAGTGFTSSGEDHHETNETIRAYGVGLRFRALAAQNVWLGLDVAQGPEDYYWYIQMGHPW
jgi:hypothetical protein